MSKIDELLKNEKVEWKKIGDIPEIKVVSPKRKLKKNEYLDEGVYPIIDQGQSFIVGYTNDSSSTFDKNSYVIFGDHSETLKYVDFQFAQGSDGIKVLKTDEDYVSSRYLYHAILHFYKITGEYKRHFSILKKTTIPIPSIPVQEKIVEILDNFRNYVTELQAELQARTKQYEYYRDMLLSEEYLDKFSVALTGKSQLVWRKIDEIAVEKLSYGSGASAIDYDGKNRYIRITDINSTGELNNEKKSPNVIEENYVVHGGDILLARSGATVGKNYIHLTNERCIYAGYLIRLVVNREIALPKFVFYCLNTSRYKIFIENTKSKGSQPNINAKQYGNFEIPIVPIKIQTQIVETIDNFQSLLADTKGLIPKEIELRQKQYEYYREKLLDFKK